MSCTSTFSALVQYCDVYSLSTGVVRVVELSSLLVDVCACMLFFGSVVLLLKSCQACGTDSSSVLCFMLVRDLARPLPTGSSCWTFYGNHLTKRYGYLSFAMPIA